MKRTLPKDWQCNFCGNRMTWKAAERAVNGESGCTGCGEHDIEPAVLIDGRDELAAAQAALPERQ